MHQMTEKPLLKDFEPRLYQEAIFSKAALNNTLVVLPTGLGKTGIAMLMAAQRLALYPQSKVLLLAPTKPLCQQHEATFRKHLVLDDDEFALFTGSVPPQKRKTLWRDARVIFSTPQTVENDLLTRNIAFDNVSLVIFDEAHRASGDYAYVAIAKHYATYGTYQRVLALTASPGTNKEQIDAVIKNLFVEHVELRTTQDPDVKPYVQDVEIEYVMTPLPAGFLKVKKLLEQVYGAKLRELQSLGHADRADFTKGGLLALQGKLHGQIASGDKDYSILKSISVAAEALKANHALELLESQGLEPLVQYARDLQRQKSKAAQNLCADGTFKHAINAVHELLDADAEHPKLEKVREIISSRKDGEKAIIFANYRLTGQKLKETLDTIGIESRVFVGQAKKGESGMSQKEQKETVAQFREGRFPVLIATSVGEEGLDIPAVDLVLFYEPVPSGIRSIQRRGRTARHATGRVLVLVSEGTRDVAYRWSSHHKERRMERVLKSYTRSFTPQGERQQTLPVPEAEITADFREKGSGVLKALQEVGVQPVLAHLSVADYVLSGRVAIELKTVEDFVNSIIDGRLLEQLRQLRSYEAPLLIIQGTEDLFSVRNIHPNAIRGMIGAITTGYRIPIIQTKTPLETASLIKVLLKREEDADDKTPLQAKPKSLREQQEHVIASLPGVGPALARPLLEHFGSVANVFAAGIEDLRQVSLIGEKKAAAIRELLDAPYRKQ